MNTTKQKEIEALIDAVTLGFIQQNCVGVEEITVKIANAIPDNLLTETTTLQDVIEHLANKYLNKD